jgi:perosamine synthetase
MKMGIPLYRPYVGRNEKKAVLRVLSSGKLSRGRELEEFEKEFAQFIGKRYAIAVNSGTSGLHVLIRCLGWKSGDEIITTPFSYIASSNVILLENATPIFVDIDPKTLNIDPERIEEKITKKTKGILLVHTLGLPAVQDKIIKISKKYKLQIIEDACETLGKPTKLFNVSSLGVATVYGFFENKQLTTGGEGGMIVTNDPNIAEKCRSMRDRGRSTCKNWMREVILGFSFRMTEMQAAFGRAQLHAIEPSLKERERLARKYSVLLRDVEGLTLPEALSTSKRSWFVFFILAKDQGMRNKIQEALLKSSIDSSANYFPPIYKFPAYASYRRGRFPNTERISKTLLALPLFCGMKHEEIRLITKIIKVAIKNG